MPLLDLAIEQAGEQGIDEIVMGMAHRGRLNVLANIMGKSARQIFREFEDRDPELHLGRGDVKYHLGYSTDWTTASRQRDAHLAVLQSQPSGVRQPRGDGPHCGPSRTATATRERKRGWCCSSTAMPRSPAKAWCRKRSTSANCKATARAARFTSSSTTRSALPPRPTEGRSSVYATDVAKMLQIPIFHVNGEDPEAVAQVVRLAMDFRREFARDVVIDMYCYRLHGHNESDEPAFTQPMLYRAIDKRESVQEHYLRSSDCLGKDLPRGSGPHRRGTPGAFR